MGKMKTKLILTLNNPLFALGWQARVVQNLAEAYRIVRIIELGAGRPITFQIRTECAD